MDNEVELTVHIAESASFAFLGVMKTASPIDCNVALLAVQTGGTLHATTSADTAELEQAIEHGTIISDIVFALLF